jgi:hypothetical protein
VQLLVVVLSIRRQLLLVVVVLAVIAGEAAVVHFGLLLLSFLSMRLHKDVDDQFVCRYFCCAASSLKCYAQWKKYAKNVQYSPTPSRTSYYLSSNALPVK